MRLHLQWNENLFHLYHIMQICLWVHIFAVSVKYALPGVVRQVKHRLFGNMF